MLGEALQRIARHRESFGQVGARVSGASGHQLRRPAPSHPDRPSPTFPSGFPTTGTGGLRCLTCASTHVQTYCRRRNDALDSPVAGTCRLQSHPHEEIHHDCLAPSLTLGHVTFDAADATVLDEYGAKWVTLADPEGNLFDIARSGE